MRKINLIPIISILIVIAMSGCINQSVNTERRVLIVIPGNDFDDMQYTIVYARLLRAGFVLDVANPDGKAAMSNRGMFVTPDLALADANERNYCSIFITGGASTQSLYTDKRLADLVVGFDKADKVIGAVEFAPVILAKASILKNTEVSAWPTESKILAEYGAILKKNSVVSETDNIITGIGGSDENYTAFTLKYIEAINRRITAACPDCRTPDKNIELMFDASKTRFVMTHSNKTRTGEIFIPRTYDGTRQYSLVLALHGKLETGRQFRSRTGFDKIASELGFIMVYPDNYTGDWDILPATETINDDIGFLASLIDELKRKFSIDPARVYATGHSDGAFMTYRVAYDLSDRIAAIAPVAGLVYTPVGTVSKPRPVSVLHIHALDDQNVPFEIDDQYEDPLAVTKGLDLWKSFDSISGEENVFYDRYGIKGTSWSDKAGQKEVALFLHPSGGHSWLPFSTERIAHFFYNHPPRSNGIQTDYRSFSIYNETGSVINIAPVIRNHGQLADATFYVNDEKIGEKMNEPFSIDWTPSEPGTYRLTMKAVSKNGEIIRSTNNETLIVTLPDIAQNAIATASGAESGDTRPENTTDRDPFSRWSSEWSDGQWIEIDLRKNAEVNGITIVWETAFATGYEIQTSTDRKHWNKEFSTESGAGGLDYIPFDTVNARYIRLNCIKRATQWGNSVWDIMVHGNDR